jgi:CHAT domain-containing protein/tetratricopeptide (TPR) repeat protein
MAQVGHTKRAAVCAIWFLIAIVANTHGAAPVDALDERLEAGVVVVGTIAPGSSSLRAGLQTGDLIVSWRPASRGESTAASPLTTPFAFTRVEIEQMPRQPVVLAGARNGAFTEWTITPGILGLSARPSLPPAILAIYQSASDHLRDGRTKEGANLLRDAATEARAAGSVATSAWLLSRAVGTLITASLTADAEALATEAQRQFTELNQPDVLAQWHRQRGRWFARYDPIRAAAEYQTALRLDEQLATDSLSSALDHRLIGANAYQRGDMTAAGRSATRALALREKLAPQSVEVAESLNDLSGVFGETRETQKSTDLLAQAVAILERLAPGSAMMGRGLHNLGVHAHNSQDFRKAEEYYRRGLAIRESAAPNSLDVSLSLNSLALVAKDQGELNQAEVLHLRALAIQEREVPRSVWTAGSLGNLGVVARRLGDLAAAEAYLRRALALDQELAPNSLGVAADLSNLGNVLMDRGDLDQADIVHRQALALREKLQPNSLLVGGSLNNVGSVAMSRRDYSAAGDYMRRALALKQKLAPRSPTTVVSLNNMAEIALARNDFKTAQSSLLQALSILDETAPKSLERLVTLRLMSVVAAKRKDFSAARTYGVRAIELGDSAGRLSVEMADALQHLGDVLLQTNDPTAASYVERSLAISNVVAPGSLVEATAYHLQGLIHRKARRTEAALESFMRAIDSFEMQSRNVGGAQDARSGFGTAGAAYYRDAVNLALQLRPPEVAFKLQEQSRARAFLSTLAERDLLFQADIPAEIARDQRLTDREYDRTVQALASLGQDKKTEITQQVARLRELRDRREELVQRVRQLSPSLAALKYPEPLDLQSARATLDQGTVLLAYWVGQNETRLFAVQPLGTGTSATGLTVFTLPVTEARLRLLINRLNTGIMSSRMAPVPSRAVGGVTGALRSPIDAVNQQAAELYNLLLRPAAKLIAPSTRLVIVPDGPLHTLPFSALRVPADGRSPSRYLVEAKPIHSVISATVYQELRAKRRPAGASRMNARLAAFGDPVYPQAAAQLSDVASTSLRAVFNRGFVLSPLPATRKEVEGIGRLFPGAADVYVGADATEERAKLLDRNVSFVHFASHAVLDRDLPLNSALVLSIPGEAGRANGLLQVWEVFEHLRLDADLVTLSACETGLGKEFNGEGLVGLTRAFQFAGARSVVASLWSVADDSTAQLMLRFYGHLRGGKSKDEALRLAQLEAIRAKSPWSHPFHWAAFQLFGDWQ